MDSILPKPVIYDPNITALKPKPGTKIQVIGAGLPRTGTNSFCAAVSHLLNGPAYHVGIQTCLTSNPQPFLDWIEIQKLRIANDNHPSPAQKTRLLEILERELDGFVTVIDPPATQLIPELMHLYPDAKVICTTRDMDSWVQSLGVVAKVANHTSLDFVFFWIRVLRHFPTSLKLMNKMFIAVYGQNVWSKESAAEVWQKHENWLREIVPKEKLYFVDVTEGWGPLCEALGVEVPVGVEFPRMNDAKTLEGAFKAWAVQGLTLWGFVLGGVVAAGGLAGLMMYRRRL